MRDYPNMPLEQESDRARADLQPERRVRAVIVDDEPPAREQIVTLLSAESDLVIAGEAESGNAAIELIRRVQPDVAFLDVQMSGCDGVNVVRAIVGTTFRR